MAPSLIPRQAQPTTTEFPNMVRLVSHDGQEFAIDKDVALQSRTLAMFLSPELGFQESRTGVIKLKDIPAKTLERVVDFLIYRKKYDGMDNPPAWDIKAEESLDLLLVADYLEM